MTLTTTSASSPHATVADRVAHGKAARAATPRSSHAELPSVPDRADPIEILERQALTRLPDLVPIRYGRMLASPFAFYRGSAAIMAADLAATPRTDLTVQCCGDAHLSNFGVFAAPDRRLVFDLNDFDETLPGPWEWDVKRLAASLMIAAQDNGFRRRDQRQVVLDCIAQYRKTMGEFAGMGNLEVWYARFEIESALEEHADELRPRAARRTRETLAKARRKNSVSAMAKLTHVEGGEPRIIDQSPLIVPLDAMADGAEREAMLGELQRLLEVYCESLPMERRRLVEQFRLVDFARKVVGVGSVGTATWIALLIGPVGEEPLFLQIKEAQASVLEEHLGPAEFDTPGQRVVVGQRLMQAASDIFLGWLTAGREYYGRQLKDGKASAEIEDMLPDGMALYGRMCAWALARAHARTGDRVAIAAYLGSSDTFDQAILAFSQAYAERNERDYNALQAAVEAGRIAVVTGV